MTLADVEDLITPAQAGRLLGVTSERVRQLADGGRLPVVRSPLGRLFDRADVEALAKSRAQADV